jgi:hypothetical protein
MAPLDAFGPRKYPPVGALEREKCEFEARAKQAHLSGEQSARCCGQRVDVLGEPKKRRPETALKLRLFNCGVQVKAREQLLIGGEDLRAVQDRQTSVRRRVLQTRR